MRILHVNKFLYRRGGAESYMMDLAVCQEAAGHDVATFGMAHPENVAQRYSDTFPSYVEFDPVPASFTARVTTFGRMLYSTSARRGMRAILDRFSPDIVHFHNIYHQLSPSILGPVARAGVPMVMTLHDFKLACPTYGLVRQGVVCEACIPRRFDRAVRLACHQGSRASSAAVAVELSAHTLLGAYRPIQLFLCPSQFLFDKMTEARVFPDRLRRVDNFVDADRCPPKTAPGDGVLFVGRLADEKGVDVLIRAAARLPGGHVDVVGDGPERAALEELAQRIAPGQVTFHGRLGGDEVLSMMSGARVVAVPTRRYENQPMVVLESFAAGTHVVTTGHGGGPELATDPRVATLVPPNDDVALAAALGPFLESAERSLAAMAPCRARAVQVHGAPRHLARIEDLYREAAELARRPGAVAGGGGAGAVGRLASLNSDQVTTAVMDERSHDLPESER